MSPEQRSLHERLQRDSHDSGPVLCCAPHAMSANAMVSAQGIRRFMVEAQNAMGVGMKSNAKNTSVTIAINLRPAASGAAPVGG